MPPSHGVIRPLSALLVASVWCLAEPVAARAASDQFDQLQLTTVVSERPHTAEDSLPLLIHFHGAPDVTEANFRRAGLSGVLVTINCRGLSSAYRRPFEDEELFDHVLDDVKRNLARGELLGKHVDWARIDVSCFSAGYGAVRELLRRPTIRQRIDAVVAADSIYASIHKQGDKRTVDADQMAPFVSFARQAAKGKKMLLVTHSQMAVEPYASTVETADYLLSKTRLARRPIAPQEPPCFAAISRASAGQFTVLGYPGDDGEAHMTHLRQIGDFWKELQAVRVKGRMTRPQADNSSKATE